MSKVQISKQEVIDFVKGKIKDGYPRFPEKGQPNDNTVYGEMIKLLRDRGADADMTKAEMKMVLKWPELKGLRAASNSTTSRSRRIMIFTDEAPAETAATPEPQPVAKAEPEPQAALAEKPSGSSVFS